MQITLSNILFMVLSINSMNVQGNTENKSSAQIYRKNSQIQTSNAQTFLEKFTFRGDEKILDVGCGDGRITQFIATKVPNGMVKGIDTSKQMIDLANESYPNLSFEKVDALEYNDDIKYDVITCFSTLHWFLDQQAFFERMKGLLTADGKMYILAYSPVDSYWEPMEDGASDDKWENYFDKKAFYCQLPKEALMDEIEKAGLSIVSFESTPNSATFKGKEGYINHICGFLPHLNRLPKKYHEEFLSDIGSYFLKRNALDADGCAKLEYETYEIVLSLDSS